MWPEGSIFEDTEISYVTQDQISHYEDGDNQKMKELIAEVVFDEASTTVTEIVAAVAEPFVPWIGLD